MSADAFPAFPPGFWRRIEVHGAPTRIVAALEDDVHAFAMDLVHDGGTITAATASADRTPWTSCPDAAPFLAERLVGRSLGDVAALERSVHCTHLFELAGLCAALADAPGARRFDMQVADRVDERTTATLLEDGEPVLRWRLEGTVVRGGDWNGIDLRRLSASAAAFPPALMVRARLLRRAVFVSGARRLPATMPAGDRAIDGGFARMGVCFTYQLPRAADARRRAPWRRDFSMTPDAPLARVDPDRSSAGGVRHEG